MSILYFDMSTTLALTSAQLSRIKQNNKLFQI